jgi:hypothetical protein
MMAIELVPFGSAWLRLNALHIIAEGVLSRYVTVAHGNPDTRGPMPSNR